MKVQFAQKAIIINGEEVLLIQKGSDDPHHPFKWEIPGGRMEEGETVDEHIKREVKEEVGLDIDPRRPLAIWSWQLGEGPAAPTVVAVARHCSIVGGASVSLDGHDQEDFIQSWKWVPMSEISEYDLIPNAREHILSSIREIAACSAQG